jgi:hypothetical protein
MCGAYFVASSCSNAFAAVVQKLSGDLLGDMGAKKDMTTKAMEQFNKDVPNVAGIEYFSLAGLWPATPVDPA